MMTDSKTLYSNPHAIVMNNIQKSVLYFYSRLIVLFPSQH